MAAPPQPRALTLHHHHLRRQYLVLIAVLTIAAAPAAPRCAASTHTSSASAPAAETPPPPSPEAVSFLRARCATTLYPSLCYASLLPYASEFHQNPARLARAAADLAAARLRALSARVKAILHLRHEHETAAALRDCASTISAAASLARQSSAELAKLQTEMELDGGGGGGMSGAGGGREERWEVSNAKTWLSAAMADEGTCADGLVEAGGAAGSSADGKEVTAGVVAVKQYTSNALALVNGIPV